MQVRYADKRVALVETNQAHTLRLPDPGVKAARRKIRLLRACRDEGDIRAMTSLRYKELKGKRDGQRSIRLNDQWRLIVQINQECDPAAIEIIQISNHYQ